MAGGAAITWRQCLILRICSPALPFHFFHCCLLPLLLPSLVAAVKTLPTLELSFVTLAALNYTAAAAALAIRAVPRPHTPESMLYIDLTSGKQKPKTK